MEDTVYTRGILYVVTTQKSDKYLLAAIRSAESAKKICPDLGRHMFTDANGLEIIRRRCPDVFTSTGVVEDAHYRSKVDYICKTPFPQTLYLDSDTIVVADIREMFELLGKFDMACAHSHNRCSKSTTDMWREQIPASFPQVNSGVMLFRNTEKVIGFLKRWSTAFHEAGHKRDQVSLRELLWTGDLNFWVLPPEYNVRDEKYLLIWKEKEAMPKILHMSKFHGKTSSSMGMFRRLLLKYLRASEKS